MKSPVVLAYAGGIHASAAVPWLIDTYGVEVVTVTLDIGQGRDLNQLRAQALACGAVRAHVIDARDEFAREALFPALFMRPAGGPQPPIAALSRPLIARKLIEIARIERAGAVAHGSSDATFDTGIHAVDPSMAIIAPAREWTMSTTDLGAYARARQLPVHVPSDSDGRIEQNLWGRLIAWDGSDEPSAVQMLSTRRPTEPAFVDIHFEDGVPVSVNGVPMAPAELLECLALIGGQHGIGRTTTIRGSHHVLYDVPAAVILQAAASSTGVPATADVGLKLADGQYTVLSADDRQSLLVNYA